MTYRAAQAGRKNQLKYGMGLSGFFLESSNKKLIVQKLTQKLTNDRASVFSYKTLVFDEGTRENADERPDIV